MSGLVLDCSVTISWLIPDEESKASLLDLVTGQGAIVPSLWFLEVGNVLLMAQCRQRLTSIQRQEALHTLTQLPIVTDSLMSQYAWSKTMNLADQYSLTLYDASYLELALRRDLPLATYDKSLQHAAQLVGVQILKE